MVHGQGEIWLPWFEEAKQCVATIVVDRGVRLRATLPGGNEEVIVCKPVDGAYQASVPIETLEDHVVHLRLCSVDAGVRWRLKSVELCPV